MAWARDGSSLMEASGPPKGAHLTYISYFGILTFCFLLLLLVVVVVVAVVAAAEAFLVRQVGFNSRPQVPFEGQKMCR